MSVNPDRDEIHQAIRKKYAAVAQSAEGMFEYETGRQGALKLGYDREILQKVPEEILRSFCGVGNPFDLGPLHRGDVVLDVGCGAGVDCIVARHHVGDDGFVNGIDLSEEMVQKARRNVRALNFQNIRIQQSSCEHLPFEQERFDTVLSNGVYNLSPDKERAFREAFRVLKPGGRIQFADVVLEEDAKDVSTTAEDWAG